MTGVKMSLLQGNHLVGAAAAVALAMLLPAAPAAASQGKQKQLEDYPAVKKAGQSSVKKDGVSLLINLSGEPCARVLSKKHVGGDRFEVVCQENRQGSGTARYMFDGARGRAVRIR
jgi:hypothetical protein